jgi:hypothetical protein
MRRIGRLFGRLFERPWLRRGAVAFALLAAYPVFVLGSVYATVLRSDFPGGQNGPKDAYRHTLASATVAYTVSPRLVAWVTRIMEHGEGGDAANAMDRHNNRIGAGIGARAESWTQMRTDVLAAVKAGGVDTADDHRITWLPPEQWRERLY